MFGLLYHPNEYCGGVCSILKQNVIASFYATFLATTCFQCKQILCLKARNKPQLPTLYIYVQSSRKWRFKYDRLMRIMACNVYGIMFCQSFFHIRADLMLNHNLLYFTFSSSVSSAESITQWLTDFVCNRSNTHTHTRHTLSYTVTQYTHKLPAEATGLGTRSHDIIERCAINTQSSLSLKRGVQRSSKNINTITSLTVLLYCLSLMLADDNDKLTLHTKTQVFG